MSRKTVSGNFDDVILIVPAWNEGKVIASTIADIPADFPNIVVITDGSTDDTRERALETRAMVVSHATNLGQGAALQTGLDYALQFPQFRYFVTFDADGQHNIEDVRHMLEVLQEQQLDVVLGSRFLGSAANITRTKKMILHAAIRFTNVFSRVALTDTHNGLRVFTRDFASKINNSMPGMAHASEIIDKIGNGGWNYAEVPVTIRYSDYSVGKGQSMLNSINILADLLLNRISK